MRQLCQLSDIEEGGLLALDLAEESVVLYRRGASVRAWHNVCPHAGRRLDWAPGRFLRDGANLVCAQHGAVFELAGGVCVSGPCRGQALVALPVVIHDGEVWVDA